MAEFRSINPQEIFDNPFKLIGSDWGLVTAGNHDSMNTMTVSWGGVGIMWNRPVAFTFIRPQRYTFEFVEREEFYSVCFFDEQYRGALSFCGSKSGRDYDKIKESGLTPVYSDGTVYYEEAKLVLICKKIAVGDIKPEQILDKTVITRCYPDSDFHKVFVGEIVKVLEKE